MTITKTKTTKIDSPAESAQKVGAVDPYAQPEFPGRRDFLRKTITLIPAASLASCGISDVVGQTESLFSLQKKPVATTDVYLPKYFTVDEWTFINAACARLIPEDEAGVGAIEAGVPEFIDRQLDGEFGHAVRWYMHGPFVSATPEFGYQGKATPREVYRAGIAAIDDYCMKTYSGKRFAQNDPSIQDHVLKNVESGDIAFENVAGKTFFGWLLQNTKEGYLADPIHGGNKNMAAWKMIGFPGARADFADWVARHGEHYPIGPVGIAGSSSRGSSKART